MIKWILTLWVIGVANIAFGQGSNSDLVSVDLDLNNTEQIKTLAFKNGKNSNLNWNNVPVEKFLSFKRWKEDTDEKVIYPEWESIIKERNNKEIIGHFFQCNGTCRVDRGESFFNPKFRSNLYEGDEVQTIGDSYAWIFLIDGTIVRLSPDSSITLNEINIGLKENFINARINSGNIFWQSRIENKYIENNLKETDLLFTPLNLYEAQPERDLINYKENKLFRFLDDTETTINQYKRLNNLIENNNSWVKNKKTFVFLVASNITVMGYSPMIEFVSLLGGKSYLKSKLSDDLGIEGNIESTLSYQLRGYENKELIKLEAGKWFEVDEKGRSVKEAENISQFVVGEFLTRRIPSLLVARELIMNDYSKVLFQDKFDRVSMAKNYGYRIWGEIEAQENKKDDLHLRLEFLKEYFRRIETTNLLVAERFRGRMQSRGENLKIMEYSSYFYLRALNFYNSYVEYSDDNEYNDPLNSTQKNMWKIMHGLK
jgi:hypothetical protein